VNSAQRIAIADHRARTTKALEVARLEATLRNPDTGGVTLVAVAESQLALLIVAESMERELVRIADALQRIATRL